ncbi:MAG: Ig-like domain-containing protein [Anaerolineae bacterium]
MKHRSLLLILLLISLLSITGLSAQDQSSDNPLQVLETYPLVGQELELRADIVLYFDRDLDCSTSSALTITPEIAGEVTCAASTLHFVPGVDYARATAYIVSVSTALRGVDGAALEEPFTLTLNTIGYLQVAQVLPADGAVDVEANAAITVIFNRPVVELTTAEAMANLPSPISITPAAQGAGRMAEHVDLRFPA